MSVVVVVICASCAGYGVCKLFFSKLLLSKRIFERKSVNLRAHSCDF